MKCAEMADLKLDDPRSIGYTYKCMSAALTALRIFSRMQQDGTVLLSDVFKTIISALIAQGGDADTNAAVAGAVIGCCIGYENLPSKWIQGMPYVVWLDAWVQKLLYMMQF